MRSGQIRMHDVIYASLFRFGYQYLEKLTLYEHAIVWRSVGKSRLTLYERWKVRGKTRLLQHLVARLQEKTSKLQAYFKTTKKR